MVRVGEGMEAPSDGSLATEMEGLFKLNRFSLFSWPLHRSNASAKVISDNATQSQPLCKFPILRTYDRSHTFIDFPKQTVVQEKPFTAYAIKEPHSLA